tara:strand:- start:2186 stop:4924 length:2739 start_codon:yes stop_codon:yes gene_type:complete
MGITLRIVTGSVLTYGQVDTNFSSLYYSASQSGNNLVLYTTGSLVQAATTTAFNLGLGDQTIASGPYSHAEGWLTLALERGAHAEGQQATASGTYSHAEGYNTKALANASHAEGSTTTALGPASHAEGYNTVASGDFSHAEGTNTIASGLYSHAEGDYAKSIGSWSHAEGSYTSASGNYSHAEGGSTLASGPYSHAEGLTNNSLGPWSHAEGQSTISSGTGSHTEGLYTTALGNFQHVQGQYNITSPFQSAFILGNGTSDGSRSNLIYASGSQVQISGSLTVGSGSSTVAPTYGFTPNLAIGLPTGSTGAVINLSNTRGIIVGGDTLGILQFSGLASGTSYASSQIRATVNYSAGSGNAGGGILSFWTGLANSGAFPEERMRINHQGNVGIGTSAPTAKLDVNGNVIITGSLNVSSNATIRQNIYTGVTPPGGTSGGYFNVYNSLSPAYSEFGFYSTDNADSDGYGDVRITANPESGISLYGSTYSGTEVSAITVQRGYINISTPTASLYSLSSFKITSPLVQITGSLRITGSAQITGSLTVTGGITGSVSNVKVVDNQFEDFNYHPVFTQAAGNSTLQIDTNTFRYNPSSDTLKAGDLSLTKGGSRLLTMEAETAGGTEIRLLPNTTGGHARINVGNTNQPLDFQMNSANVMRITQAGNVGIGTTIPSAKLDVNGSTVITGSLSNGNAVRASGLYSHAEGSYTTASGNYSHAEGESTTASGEYSHAEGEGTVSSGLASHTEGIYTVATGNYSHAEGESTAASGFYSHAEGSYTSASGDYSHAEGGGTTASGEYSHAEGEGTFSSGLASHTEGLYTVATGNYQHVQGQYNISSSARSAFIIGNGTADGSRSNLVFASGSSVQITGSLMLKDILVLAPRTTTPTPSTGMVIVSGSGVDQHIYCYLNSTWKQLD